MDAGPILMTRIVPGTHKSGINPPPVDRAIKHVLTATAPAGSVLVFNGQCWHGGGANTGDRDRHAIFGHYRISPMMRFQLDPHHSAQTLGSPSVCGLPCGSSNECYGAAETDHFRL